MTIIYLATTLLLWSCCLPSNAPAQGEIKRAAFWRWCTWHYSTQGLPTIKVTHNSRELLPHVFTLIRPAADSYFLWHFLSCLLVVTNLQARRLTGVSPFAVRTFLPEMIGTMAWLIER